MSFTVFKRGEPDRLAAIEVEGGTDRRRGVDHRAGEALENVVNVGIALGRPILISGEAGCGKTELGFSIARKLGIARLHFYAVKSDSDARSLFYEYDTVGRFHAAQIGQASAAGGQGKTPGIDARHFIEYRALGRAILDAYPLDEIKHLIGGRYRHPEQPQRSVVVIDEIDKASRDFPNDLLNEIDQFWFRVPELGFADLDRAPETPRTPISPAVRPIVVITSNTERQLPDAFLRRCVYHHITFPDQETLRRIVDSRLALIGERLTEEDSHRAFWLIGKARVSALEKPPGTAELIDFLHAIARRRSEFPDEAWRTRFLACIHAVAKTDHDNHIIAQLLSSAPE
jgi:MoxR-like ATPase